MTITYTERMISINKIHRTSSGNVIASPLFVK